VPCCEFTISGQSLQFGDLKHSPSTTESPGLPLRFLMVLTRKMFMWCEPGGCWMA
jgi:hypothetical protein